VLEQAAVRSVAPTSAIHRVRMRPPGAFRYYIRADGP
jgi:hypothetical protein